MDVTFWRSVATVACFFTFMGIVIWAYSRSNQARFNEDAQIPFQQD